MFEVYDMSPWSEQTESLQDLQVYWCMQTSLKREVFTTVQWSLMLSNSMVLSKDFYHPRLPNFWSQFMIQLLLQVQTWFAGHFPRVSRGLLLLVQCSHICPQAHIQSGKPSNQPTIWRWIVPPIQGDVGDSFWIYHIKSFRMNFKCSTCPWKRAGCPSFLPWFSEFELPQNHRSIETTKVLCTTASIHPPLMKTIKGCVCA